MNSTKIKALTVTVGLIAACITLLTAVIKSPVTHRFFGASGREAVDLSQPLPADALPSDESSSVSDASKGSVTVQLPSSVGERPTAEPPITSPREIVPSVVLRDGDFVKIPALPGGASATFSDEYGGFATLRVVPDSGPALTEAVYGAGGSLSVLAAGRQRRITITNLDLQAKTLTLNVD